MGDLEIIPPRSVDRRGHSFEELDVDAIIARGPDVVLVDELAHTNADGIRRRWEDVDELLQAGLGVMTTLNVANLLSVRDYVARITGAGTVEYVPDEFVRSGEVVLIDLPPEVLRRRIVAGLVYSADVLHGALSDYFRGSNLARLSALARAWMDGTVDVIGPELLVDAGLEEATPRPTIVAGVSSAKWAPRVIRRAAMLAAEEDADLLVLHVNVTDGLRPRPTAPATEYEEMVERAGGSYADVTGSSVVEALATTAREKRASHVVVARHRSRLEELVRGSIASRLRKRVPDIDVEEVTAVCVTSRSAITPGTRVFPWGETQPGPS